MQLKKALVFKNLLRKNYNPTLIFGFVKPALLFRVNPLTGKVLFMVGIEAPETKRCFR